MFSTFYPLPSIEYNVTGSVIRDELWEIKYHLLCLIKDSQ